MMDYTVSCLSSHLQEFDLFVVEVKVIGRTSSGQLPSDLVKLGKEMKRMVDRLLDKIFVGSVLVESVSCSTYITELNYDGVDRITQLADFYLLRGPCVMILNPDNNT